MMIINFRNLKLGDDLKNAVTTYNNFKYSRSSIFPEPADFFL